MISLDFFLSDYRQKILGLLLLHPEQRYHVRAIARLTNTAAGSVHKELTKLANAEVLKREVSGNQVYYQANIHFPIFNELASILRKTSGLANILTHALAPLADKIEVAFIFGSMAHGKPNPGSDVDVLIIGDIGFAEAVTVLYASQEKIGREINPKVYSRAEWEKVSTSENSFLSEILNKQKIFLIGTQDDLK
jgi:predicted nucleotidyltransferase